MKYPHHFMSRLPMIVECFNGKWLCYYTTVCYLISSSVLFIEGFETKPGDVQPYKRLKNKALKYFIIGLVAYVVIVFLILLVFSVGYDGTCHTLLGGSFACSFDRYFENDVLRMMCCLV